MAHQPIRDEFNEESIKEFIFRRLGGSTAKDDPYPIDIELTNGHYLQAIEEAFELYSRANPKYSRLVIPVVQEETKYPLPYVGRGIVEVQPERYQNLLVPNAALSINLGEGVVSSVSPVLRQSYGIDAIYEALIYGEMYQRVVGGDFQWEYENGYLYLSHIPFGNTYVAVIYAENHDYESVPVAARDWIKRYAVESAKEMLGRRRGKFGTPGPSGQQFLQDALNLVQEGQNGQDKLKQELRSRTPPLPPTWGA